MGKLLGLDDRFDPDTYQRVLDHVGARGVEVAGLSLTAQIPDPESGLAFTAVGPADPAVHWMGHDSDIFLHPRCVLDLFVRLARDVHETECTEHYRQLREGYRLLQERRAVR